jgi:UDP-N-acetylglucosamine 2-epimerase
MISRIADMHFAPTTRSHLLLLAEGIPGGKVQMTGNTVVDAQNWAMRHDVIDGRPRQPASVLVTVHLARALGQRHGRDLPWHRRHRRRASGLRHPVSRAPRSGVR